MYSRCSGNGSDDDDGDDGDSLTGRRGWWKSLPAQRIILDEEGGPEDWVIFGRAMMGHEGLLLKERAKAQRPESQNLPRKQRV